MLDRDRIKSNGLMKLITVKIKWAKVEDDDHKESDNSFDGPFGASQKLHDAEKSNQLQSDKNGEGRKEKKDQQ